nr:hypothetical protein [Geodermatophilus africanus]
MAVGVDGDADRGVPEHFRDDRHRYSGGEHQRRRTVPEVVQPHRPQASSPGQRDETAGHVLRSERGAVLAREDQVVVLVGVTPGLSVDVLAETPLQQRLHSALRERHRRLGRAGLRCGELEPAADVNYGLPNPGRAVGQVEVGPAQAEGLTAAQSAGGDDLEQGAESIGLDVPQEYREFCGRPWVDLRPRAVRWRDVAGHVERQATGLDAVAERGPERRVDASHGYRPTAVHGVRQELFHVLSPQSLQRHVADRGDDDVLHMCPV